jgi:hypothetical protein
MSFTAFSPAGASGAQLALRPELGGLTAAGVSADRSNPSPGVRILVSQADLEVALHRVEAFELRLAEELANRTRRHQQALAGSVRDTHQVEQSEREGPRVSGAEEARCGSTRQSAFWRRESR